VDADEIGRLIGELETRVERLRSLYEQYFMGIERLEPLTLRKDIDRRLWALRREQIRNTGLRFKLETTIQRYNTYQQYWARIVREIEQGTYQRDLGRAAQRFGDNVVTAFARRRQKLYEKGISKKAERDARRTGPTASQGPPPQADEAAPSTNETFDVTFEDSDVAEPPLARSPAVQHIEPLELDIGISTVPRPAPPAPAARASERQGPAPAPPREPVGSGVRPAPLGPAPANARPAPPAQSAAAIATPAQPPPVGAPPKPAPPIGAAGKPAAPLGAQVGLDASGADRPLPARPSLATSGPAAAQAPPKPAAPAAPFAKPAAPAAPFAKPAAPPAPFAKPVAPPATTGKPVAGAAPAAPALASPKPPAGGVPPRHVVAASAKPAGSAVTPSPANPPSAIAASPPGIQPGARPAERPPISPTRTAGPGRPDVQPRSDEDGSLSPIRMRQIYGAFVEAKRRANESTASVTYEKIASNLESVAKELRAKHNARTVDFEVVMKNGKPVLKPVVKG
jgi:hypothetical protein